MVWPTLGSRKANEQNRTVERITVIKFGVNDGGGNGARCGGIKVRTDTTKLRDMVVASFGDG